MSPSRAPRILQVTIGLSITGSVVGGILGALLLVALGARIGHLPNGEVLRIGAGFGAIMGAVLAPIAAWTLMRDVPIWRAIAETALGTVAGAGLGLMFPNVARLSPPLLGIAGFTLAAIRLRLASRRRLAGRRT